MNRTVLSLVAVAVLSVACGPVETSSCGASGCTYSRSGTASSQPIGGSCANDGECSGSMKCDTTAPNGYCYQSGCSTSADCPTGGVCVTDSPNFCVKLCTASSDCRPGYRCVLFTNSNRGWCGY